MNRIAIFLFLTVVASTAQALVSYHLRLSGELVASGLSGAGSLSFKGDVSTDGIFFTQPDDVSDLKITIEGVTWDYTEFDFSIAVQGCTGGTCSDVIGPGQYQIASSELTALDFFALDKETGLVLVPQARLVGGSWLPGLISPLVVVALPFDTPICNGHGSCRFAVDSEKVPVPAPSILTLLGFGLVSVEYGRRRAGQDLRRS